MAFTSIEGFAIANCSAVRARFVSAVAMCSIPQCRVGRPHYRPYLWIMGPDSPLHPPAERSESELASIPDIASAAESELAEVPTPSEETDSPLAAPGRAALAGAAGASDSEESALGLAGAQTQSTPRGPGRPVRSARGRGGRDRAKSARGRGGRDALAIPGGLSGSSDGLSLECVDGSTFGVVQEFFRPDRGSFYSTLVSAIDLRLTASAELLTSAENLTHLVFGAINRNVATFATEARLCRTNRKTFPSLLTSFCALAFFVFVIATEAVARWLISAVLSGEYDLRAAIVFVSNDETAMYMSVPTDVSPELLAAFRQVESKFKNRKYARYLCKVMNIVCRCCFLLKSSDGEEHCVVLELPECLFNLDHNTTETTTETWKRLQRSFPQTFRLVRMAKRIIHLMINDNGVQNLRWFAKMLGCKNDQEAWLRSQCDVHQAHSAFGHGLDTVKAVFSGITNTSLAMAAANSLETLRKGVRMLGKVRIRVIKCSVVPVLSDRAQKYKTAVVRSFLKPAVHGVSALIRAFVLLCLLNGDWRVEDVIVHYCVAGCCEGVDFVDVFSQLVVDTLLPGLCPTCRRGRWMGTLHPVDWLGVLFGVHSIGCVVIPVWCRELNDSSKPMTEKDFKVAERPLASGLDALDDGPPGLLPADEEVEEALVALEASHAESGKDSPDLNELHRLQAGVFAKMRPTAWLLMVRVAMVPFLELMQGFMSMAGKRFEHNQGVAVRERKEIKYRLLECARGTLTNKFFTNVSGFMFGNWFFDNMPHGYRNERMSGSAFKFVTKGAAAVFFNIHVLRTRRFPTKLFMLADATAPQAIKDDIVDSPSCTWDDFTHVFFTWFKTRAQRLSREAIDLLIIILWLMRNETVSIEDLHAALRRYILRAVQCRKRSFEQILGDYCTMRLRLRFRDAFDERKLTEVCRRQRKGRSSERKKPLSTTWNAIRLRARRARLKAAKGARRKSFVSPWNVFASRRRPATVDGRFSRSYFGTLMRDFTALGPLERADLKREASKCTTKRRAVVFLKSQRLMAKRRRMQVTVESRSDQLELVSEVQYVQVATYLNDAETTAMGTAIAQARELAHVASSKRRRQIAAEHSAWVSWSRGVDTTKLPGRLSSLDSAHFKRCATSFPCTLVNLDLVPLAKHLFERLPKEIREKELMQEWSRFCSMIKHEDCEPAGVLAKTRAQNWCCVACRCLCTTGPTPYLLRIQQSFGRTLRSMTPPKTRMRALLSAGDIVTRILSSDGSTLWFHISFINLVTYVNVLLGLRLVPDEAMQASVRPCRLLVVDRNPVEFMTCWDALSCLSHILDHHMELWRILAERVATRPISVPVLRVALVEDSKQFWKGPVLAAGGQGADLPSGPSGGHDGEALGPPGPSVPAASLSIEDCPIEHDAIEGPSAPVSHVDGILEEAQLELPDPVMEADDPVPEPIAEPPGDPSPSADGKGDHGKGDADKGDGKGRGKGPHRFRGLAALQHAKKAWLHPRDKRTDTISDAVSHFKTGAHCGRLYRWVEGESLVYICATCEAHWQRSFLPRKVDNPDRYAQGRPIGFLLGVAQHKCTGDPHHHRFACEGLAFFVRKECRSVAISRGLFSESFKLERPPWPHETQEPVSHPPG